VTLAISLHGQHAFLVMGLSAEVDHDPVRVQGWILSDTSRPDRRPRRDGGEFSSLKTCSCERGMPTTDWSHDAPFACIGFSQVTPLLRDAETLKTWAISDNEDLATVPRP